jgi:hypothetical protein
MPSPGSTEPKFEFLRGAPGTFDKRRRACLRLILSGEHSLRRAVSNFLEHFHQSSGQGNLLLFPTGATASATQATAVRRGERLGCCSSTTTARHEFFGHMTKAAAQTFYYADSP